MMNRKFQLLQRVLCVVLVALVMFSLMGCQPEVSGTSIPLTEEKKQEINEAWKAKYGHDMPTSILYYGTYGDCVVFFQATMAQAKTEKYIAGQEFIYGSTFVLRVYRKGEFMDLEQANKKWYISKSQVKEIWEYHKSLNQRYYD